MSKSNKFYTFLRIIFLTLAIVSVVFTLAKKIGLCASDVGSRIYTKYPLPVGSPYGYGGYLSAEILNDIVDDVLVGYPDVKLITVPMIWDSNEFTVNVYTSWTGTTVSGDTQDLSNPSQVTYQGSGVSLSYRVNLSGFTGVEYTLSTGPCVPSNYVMTDLSDPDSPHYLQKNVYIPQYPLYISPDVNESVYNQAFFLLSGSSSGPSSGSSIVGKTIGRVGLEPIIDSNGDILGYSGDFETDLDLEVDTSGIEDKLDTIIGNQEDIKGNQDDINDNITAQGQAIANGLQTFAGKVDTTNGKLDTINGTLTQGLSGWEKVKIFFGWLHDHGLDDNGRFNFLELLRYLLIPSISDCMDKLEETTFYNDIKDLKDVVDDFVEDFETVPAAESYFWEFKFATNIVNHNSLLAQTGDFRVYFDFWAHIRDRFWKYFNYFFIFGNILLIIRKLPSMLKGVSSNGDAE